MPPPPLSAPARAEPSDDAKPAPDGTYPVEGPIDTVLRLECRPSGNPAPEVIWTKDGQVSKEAAGGGGGR